MNKAKSIVPIVLGATLAFVLALGLASWLVPYIVPTNTVIQFTVFSPSSSRGATGDPYALVAAGSVVPELEKFIHERFERTVQLFQITIAIFGLLLSAMAILAGLSYFNKVKEADDLMSELRSKPDEFFSRFHLEQLNKQIPALMDDQVLRRSAALRTLVDNPELGDHHYQHLLNALKLELNPERVRGMFSMFVVGSLAELMGRLRPEETLAALREEIEKRKTHYWSAYALVAAYISISPTLSREMIDQLLATDAIALRKAAVQVIALFGTVSDQIIRAVAVNGEVEDLQAFLNMRTFSGLQFDGHGLVDGVRGRKEVPFRMVTELFQSLRPEEISIDEKMDLFIAAAQTDRRESDSYYIETALKNILNDPRTIFEQMVRLFAMLREKGMTSEVLIGVIVRNAPVAIQENLIAALKLRY